MPTIAEYQDKPEGAEGLQAIAKKWQALTELPLAEAGCFYKCMTAAATVITELLPSVAKLLALREIPFLLAGEDTPILSLLISQLILVEDKKNPGRYVVGVSFAPFVQVPNNELIAMTVPLTPEEVPQVGPAEEDEEGKTWSLYPPRMSTCDHQFRHDIECPECKAPVAKALFTDKGIGDAIRRKKAPAQPS